MWQNNSIHSEVIFSSMLLRLSQNDLSIYNSFLSQNQPKYRHQRIDGKGFLKPILSKTTTQQLQGINVFVAGRKRVSRTAQEKSGSKESESMIEKGVGL